LEIKIEKNNFVKADLRNKVKESNNIEVDLKDKVKKNNNIERSRFIIVVVRIALFIT